MEILHIKTFCKILDLTPMYHHGPMKYILNSEFYDLCKESTNIYNIYKKRMANVDTSVLS